MNKKEFKDFFEPYSKNVDNANKQAFWKLSDALIFEIIKRNIPVGTSKGAVIFDAGGGTGRWICDLAKTYESDFILYDLSEDMLAVAKTNIEKAGIASRVKIIQGDLAAIGAVPDSSVDNIVSVYSPISFVGNIETAASELFRILKKDGTIMIMGHGYHNALASKINNYIASAGELRQIAFESMVKWGDAVPKLNLFSQESMEALLAGAGFTPTKTYGVPVFVQPGPEDFDATNSKKSRISAALENPDFFAQIFKMEMEFNSKKTIANRGMNIFAAAKK
ncbi:MAG TPA: methyltransferase domain-containing protein [Candidatus Paceibacterota bacterium]|nr:methyltransferase domain-containing protein [Candidatus Pacearchaeota archaeon]HRZ51514.1 methyltransferase domain-containing protein [Candidatus Paceibacterota bacterium]HSA37231.1 methyltransferase domain-containing protein [Candidatus Paceibacterota bacterium]